MLAKRGKEIRTQVELNSLEDLVPKDHLLRKIDKAINFDYIYDEVAELYSNFGRPSIDPVVLIKIVLIQYIFRIPSMRQTSSFSPVHALRSFPLEGLGHFPTSILQGKIRK
ncbi:Predicted transposase [Clostridium kluyveri DSM 555]|uniref:Predicted transposase n=2 Tax=Clostridium kluyveri TaxID=1534 RepID=A5N351_CLOK5|nr:Predicted transposase [Clostridium kluyveri DSM 555]